MRPVPLWDGYHKIRPLQMWRVKKYNFCKCRDLKNTTSANDESWKIQPLQMESWKIRPLKMEGWNKPRLCMLGVLCPAGGAGWAAQEEARVLRDQDEADYHKRWPIKKGNGACTCSLHMSSFLYGNQTLNIANSISYCTRTISVNFY